MSEALWEAVTVGAVAVSAGCLIALGTWARSTSMAVAPAWMDERQRLRRASVVRRGGVVCYLAALAMVGVAVLAVL